MTAPLSRRGVLRLAGAALASPWATALAADKPPVTADDYIRSLVRDAPLSMRFTGSTADECRAWQAAFTAKVRELLGPHDPPREWETITQSVTEFDNYRREELVLTAKGYAPLPMYVLTPKPRPGQWKPLPGIVALHGHGEFGNDVIVGRDETPEMKAAIASAHYDYGLQLVRRGYVVAAPCLMPFGRRLGGTKGTTDPCAVAFVRLQAMGKVLMAENIIAARWAIELLTQRDGVDPNRIGCVGLSYGGRMTMMTAALDPRVKVAAIAGALNMMQERLGSQFSCGAQVIPGLLQYGDTPEIASLIAPRPCVFQIGSTDKLLPPKWAAEAEARIRLAYRAMNADDQFLVDHFDGGHQWHGDGAYPLLAKALS